MTKFSSKILERIKREKMTPKPRWYFALMHTLLGTAILSSVMIGGIAIAIFIRQLTLTDWELARQFAGGYMRSFIMLIPYIWLIFIGLTILIADSLYKHTKKGHRIRLWQLIAASIVLSVAFGCLFFFTKADQPIEFSLSENIPRYAEWKNRREQIFVAPEKGVIAGEIIEIDENEKITVIDFKERKWIIDRSELKNRDEKTLEVGMKIGIIGETFNHEHFKANRITTWKQNFRPNDRNRPDIRKIPERKF